MLFLSNTKKTRMYPKYHTRELDLFVFVVDIRVKMVYSVGTDVANNAGGVTWLRGVTSYGTITYRIPNKMAEEWTD